MTTKATLNFPSYSTRLTLSGGSWETDYPLTNLQTVQPLTAVARSTDATAASTAIVPMFPADMILFFMEDPPFDKSFIAKKGPSVYIWLREADVADRPRTRPRRRARRTAGCWNIATWMRCAWPGIPVRR